MHLAGATVLRGPIGFGHSSRLHTTKILRLSQDLPIVIEIVDNEEAINKFVDAIEGMMGSALVTTEKVKVIQYGTKRVDRQRSAGALALLRPFGAKLGEAVEPLFQLSLKAVSGRRV